jgi:hypothetical protein
MLMLRGAQANHASLLNIIQIDESDLALLLIGQLPFLNSQSEFTQQEFRCAIANGNFSITQALHSTGASPPTEISCIGSLRMMEYFDQANWLHKILSICGPTILSNAILNDDEKLTNHLLAYKIKFI